MSPPAGPQLPEALAASDAVARLRGSGLRVTAGRVAVLRILTQAPHSDADSIIRGVRTHHGTVSTQAVYDVLRVLGQAGLVRRIQPAGGPARFELRVGDNHHHVVCRECGSTTDVDCAVGQAPCLDPSDDHGYRVDEAEVTYWGVCPACQEAVERRRSAGDRSPDLEGSLDPDGSPYPGAAR
ncbi:MAG: Fur family transcriptional regulator [Actinomycetes bacterium]